MNAGRTPGTSTPPSDRTLEALSLRASGLQWEEIAERMGYADKSGPSNLVRRYLRNARTEAARYVMELALYRLELMLAAVWPGALAGDLQAQGAVLRILDRQAKYLRLDGIGDAPPRNPLAGLEMGFGQKTPETWGYQDDE